MGATHSYIGQHFIETVKNVDYEIKMPINEKLMVANDQELTIIVVLIGNARDSCPPTNHVMRVMQHWQSSRNRNREDRKTNEDTH